MNKQEALKLLGVKEGVNKEELKVAFNKKAHKLHPDKKGGTSEDFIKLKEAMTADDMLILIPDLFENARRAAVSKK